jgi:hypothetical protein
VVLVLAISDEVDDALLADAHAVRQAQLIVACGDLPFDYLGRLMNLLDVPLVFVPGNHDPNVSGYRTSRAGLPLRAGLPARPPWPAGAISAEQRVVDAAGLRLLHGHIHPHGATPARHRLGRTEVRNVVGRLLLEREPGDGVRHSPGGHSHAS